MRDIGDHGEGQPGRRGGEGGLSMLDLVGLPPAQRTLMRLMLRQPDISYTELAQALAGLPAADRLSPAELDETLDALLQQHFLLRSAGEQDVTFRVNHRRTARSTRRSKIWDALDSGAIANTRRGRADD